MVADKFKDEILNAVANLDSAMHVYLSGSVSDLGLFGESEVEDSDGRSEKFGTPGSIGQDGDTTVVEESAGVSGDSGNEPEPIFT
jgi:hypothetical protein